MVSTVTVLVADANGIALARLTTGGAVGIALVVVDHGTRTDPAGRHPGRILIVKIERSRLRLRLRLRDSPKAVGEGELQLHARLFTRRQRADMRLARDRGGAAGGHWRR